MQCFNWPFPASFSIFSSFQYSWQLTIVLNKSLPIAGFDPRTSGVHGSDDWATTTVHEWAEFVAKLAKWLLLTPENSGFKSIRKQFYTNNINLLSTFWKDENKGKREAGNCPFLNRTYIIFTDVFGQKICWIWHSLRFINFWFFPSSNDCIPFLFTFYFRRITTGVDVIKLFWRKAKKARIDHFKSN